MSSAPVFFQGLANETTICAQCGYCRAVCPTYAGVGWESCSPRGRIQLTGLMLAGEPLSPEQMTRLYQCTVCSACTEVCPTQIDLRQFWLAARAEAARRDLAPPGLKAAKANLTATGNVYGYPNDERAGWAEYMDDAPEDLYQRETAAVVYFVGCSTAFSPRVQPIAESLVRLLSAAEVDFSIMGGDEVCCGFPLQVAGLADDFHSLVEHNLEQVRARGADTIVFNCPACRLMWREEYAAHLPGVRMLHATELLAELSAAGRLHLQELAQTVTYHDPCDLARNGGVYEAPRQLLAAIPGLELVEAHERRERGLCCGGGGDMEMVDPGLSQRVAGATVAKLAATGAGTIITACPQCVRTLSRGSEQSTPAVAVLDIVELLAQAQQGANGT